MRRREFITLLGGAAVSWPLAARAQQPAMPVVGFLTAGALPTYPDALRAFRQALKESGHTEGETVAIDYRFAENQPDRLPELAAELVRRRVNVIVASSAPAAVAAAQATTTIPTVFIVPKTRSGSDWSRASLGQAATPPESTSSRPNWRRSGWSCCGRWCPRPSGSPR